MEFNWYQGAEKCMNRLSEDFVRIKREYIDKRDYATAYDRRQFALMDSQHMAYEPHITENFFKGITFNASVEMLRDALEQKNESRINFSCDSLLVCIAQEKMRREATK